MESAAAQFVTINTQAPQGSECRRRQAGICTLWTWCVKVWKHEYHYLRLATGTVTMQIEAAEDAYLAKILVHEGSKALRTGTPLALLCEDEADIALVQSCTLPEHLNQYAGDSADQYTWLTWQAYLKARKPGSRGGGEGCMCRVTPVMRAQLMWRAQ